MKKLHSIAKKQVSDDHIHICGQFSITSEASPTDCTSLDCEILKPKRKAPTLDDAVRNVSERCVCADCEQATPPLQHLQEAADKPKGHKLGWRRPSQENTILVLMEAVMET